MLYIYPHRYCLFRARRRGLLASTSVPIPSTRHSTISRAELRRRSGCDSKEAAHTVNTQIDFVLARYYFSSINCVGIKPPAATRPSQSTHVDDRPTECPPLPPPPHRRHAHLVRDDLVNVTLPASLPASPVSVLSPPCIVAVCLCLSSRHGCVGADQVRPVRYAFVDVGGVRRPCWHGDWAEPTQTWPVLCRGYGRYVPAAFACG